MRQRLGVAALAASLCLLAGPVARASSVTLSQLHGLAARAEAGDATALAELRAVDLVQGQPESLAQALGHASPAELRGRLRVLAAEGSAQAPTPGQAQRAAASILSEGRFAGPAVARPLSPVQSLIDYLSSGVPGGPVLFWGALGAIVLVTAGVGASRMLGRLQAPSHAYRAAGPLGAENDPESMERAASAAESAGAFGEAVRLRFRAGLVSLGLRAAINYRPSLRTGEVARSLRSPEFDELTRTFERVAYGGATATASDAADAREGWAQVLASLTGRSR
ncbi:MAG: hypothetical protein M3071_22280 [Actinomycetota bacterium]|nr:hypothetical protein [Actinomycetota bacterium]